MISNNQKYPFKNPAVEAVFNSFPDEARSGLLILRDLIFNSAQTTKAVGCLTETLKWGQPAYLTSESKSGSTIRLGMTKTENFAIFVHCQTTILADFKELFGDEFTYDGNRAIHFKPGQAIADTKIEYLIKRALTYHLK
ncbi:MAG: DUF1801 domain-containing protein [Kordiimonadaceae bacterium]|nr:DUF1801 domain-containing protein [Kordiimonadaceae bacterium]